MAEVIRESRECCFCGEFLVDLPFDIQGEVVAVLHNVLERRFMDPFSKCETLLSEVRDTFEIDSPQYKMILKELCFVLLKAGESAAGVKLAEQQLENFEKGDFSILVTLGTIYERRGEHENALEVYKRAKDTAVQNDDTFQVALSRLKLAICYWKLGRRQLSQELLNKSQRAFQQFPAIENNLHLNALHSLVRFYKTMSYMNKLNKEYGEAKANYLKALDMVSSGSTEELTILSRLSTCFAYSMDQLAVDRNNKRAFTTVQNIIQNSQDLSAHSRQIIHILSRLGFSYSLVKNLESSLQIYEMTLEMSMKYLGMAHPEVARIASSIANLCLRRQPLRISEFVNVLEKCLKECDYKNDDAKMKRYGYEIIDALSNCGFLYSRQGNSLMADKKFKEAMDISIKVFGEDSVRTARLMRTIEKGKRELGDTCLMKSLSINDNKSGQD